MLRSWNIKLKRKPEKRRYSTNVVTAMIITLMLMTLAASIHNTCGAETANGIPKGGTLTIGVVGEIDTWNLYMGVGTVDAIEDCVYITLIYHDKNMKAAPFAAKSWSVSEDGLVWTFNLVDNAKWHDGVPFTSHDVKFTIELANKSWSQSWRTTHIVKVETPDDHTVKIYTDRPVASMLDRIGTLWLMPKHIWEKIPEEELWTFENPNPIGLGPFKFVEWRKGEYVKLEAYDEFFLGRPNIDTLIWKFYKSKDSMLLALKNGEIDVAWNVPVHSVRELIGEPNIELVVSNSFTFHEIEFSVYVDPETGEPHGHPTLLDKRVRAALAHAVDKKALVDMVWLGYAIPGVSIINPVLGEWFNPNIKEYEFNLTKAKEILTEAGYIDRDGDGIRESPDGTKLSYTMYVLDYMTEAIRASMLISEWWRLIGVELNTQVVDEGTLSAMVYNPDDPYRFEIAIWYWPNVGGDPDFNLQVMTSMAIGGWNDCGWSNATYDELYEQQVVTMDPEKRKEIVWKMQEIVYEDVPYIVLYYPEIVDAYRTDKFEGWDFWPGGILSFEMGKLFTLLNVHLKAGPSPAPTPTPTPSPTLTPAPTPTVTPSLSPTPMPAPTPAPEVVAVIPEWVWAVIAVLVIAVVVVVAYAIRVKRK